MEIETDFAEIYGGIRHGRTLGGPVGLLLKNKDWENWKEKMGTEPSNKEIFPITLPRPGHADLAGVQKFGTKDIRNILERASARETAMRVALGSFCRKLLESVGIQVGSSIKRIYNVEDNTPLTQEQLQSASLINQQADSSSVRCLSKEIEPLMTEAIDKAKAEGDSVGGSFQIVATGVPYGLGSHTQWYRKLHANIAKLILSINAFKQISIGDEASGETLGSQTHDEIVFQNGNYQRPTNHAGGIEGGMSNATPIIIHARMKPIPTLVKRLRSVDIHTHEAKDAHFERTDACAVPAAAVVAESMLCFALADSLLDKFGGDSIEQLKSHMKASAQY